MKVPYRKRTAVVVCSHRLSESLGKCVSGFLSIVDKPEDVIFVNNGSEDGLESWTIERFPQMTVISLPKNMLFCGGYNAGIRVAIERGYDYVLISNSDTQVIDPTFVEELIRASERWPRGAFFGPRVYWRSSEVIQKTCLEFPSVFRSAVTWIPWRLWEGYFHKQPDCETSVSLLNGVCVLCRVSALKDFGLMDESFGGYVEDADWAWRAREKGWVSVFTPVPSVIHHEEVDGYEAYSMKAFLMKRNTVLWFLKTGQKTSAFIYAYLSVALGHIRMALESCKNNKGKHQFFLRKLQRTYQGLLREEELGEWFGPPLGLWEV